MKIGERTFKKEYASELLKIAESDLNTARVLANTNHRVRPENILFHVGQAVEKALKSVLCHCEQPVPLTHDLLVIVTKIDGKPPGGESLGDLTPYATIRRYEEGIYLPTQVEIQNSLSLAQEVIDFANKELSR